MYEHWRVNSPDIRAIERDEHEKHVIVGWKDQITEQQQVSVKTL